MLIDIVGHHARQEPEKEAYVFLDHTDDTVTAINYRELYARTVAMARALACEPVAGERAIILLAPGIDYIVSFYACLAAGAIAVPCFPLVNGRGLDRVMAILQAARPKIIIGSSAYAPELQMIARSVGARLVCPEQVEHPSPTDDASWYRPTASASQIAFLQFTSGSTGTPKGVMVRNDNLIANLNAITERFQLTPDSVAVSWLPPYHDMGLIGNILAPMYAGCKSVLMSPFSFIQEPTRWLKAISDHQGTVSGGPNFAYRLCTDRADLSQLPTLDLSTWSVAFCGAEPIHLASLEGFAERYQPAGFNRSAFLNCYGLAESTLLVSGTRNGLSSNGKLASCGAIIPGHALRVVNPESRQLAPEGHEGEIWIQGPSVAAGYWNLPEETQATFEALIAGREDEGFYMRTGDLGYLTDDELYISGRRKDLIIIRGTNYYPQDIEAAASSEHEAINPGSVAAFSVPIDGEESLVVVAEIRRGYVDRMDAAVIQRAVLSNITKKVMAPVHELVVVAPGSVAKTSSGKIRRSQCKIDYLQKKLKRIEPKQALPV